MNFQFSTPIASFYYSSTLEFFPPETKKKGSPLISAFAKIVFCTLHLLFSLDANQTSKAVFKYLALKKKLSMNKSLSRSLV